MAIIDITPPLSAALPIFPGDTPFSAERTWEISENVPVNVSKIVMSSHAGAHADAPLHYNAAGAPIDQVELTPYIGLCAVVHIINDEAVVSEKSLTAAIDALGGDLPQRLLIRTYERQPQTWDKEFTAVAAEAINALAARGVKLVGVDTPSLDPETSKTMKAHHAIFANDMRILEGLYLDHVAPGIYELVAPPLKLQGLDAAPVRALLRTLT